METWPAPANGDGTIRRRRRESGSVSPWFGAALAGGASLCCDVLCSQLLQAAPIPQPWSRLSTTISPEPARVGPASITLKLADAAGKPVTGAKIAMEADMSHAGMSPVFAEAKEGEPGRYQAHLEFPMAGDWVVLLHITLPGGKKLERQIDVKGVRPN